MEAMVIGEPIVYISARHKWAPPRADGPSPTHCAFDGDPTFSMTENDVQTYSNCCWMGSLKRIL
jgi:hypothetical protein